MLVGLLQHKEVVIRLEAVDALSSLGPAGKVAVPALLRALLDADDTVRYRVEMALRNIDPEAAKKVGVR